MMSTRQFTVFFSLILVSLFVCADIPEVYQHIKYDQQGKMYLEGRKGKKFSHLEYATPYSLHQFIGKIKGHRQGLLFDMGAKELVQVVGNYGKILNQRNMPPALLDILRRYRITSRHWIVQIIRKDREWLAVNARNYACYKLVQQKKYLSVRYRFDGVLYYGFIKPGDGKYPQPVFFKKAAVIQDGKALIKISRMRGKYDMIGWEKSGFGTIGYRIIAPTGRMLYDGKISFRGKGPFRVGSSIVEGPFINIVTPSSVVISFTTNVKSCASIKVGKRKFSSPAAYQHEIKISSLKASTRYSYTVKVDDYSESYAFKTSPNPGSREPFIFGYASDSREGIGGGERSFKAINKYVLRKIMAVSAIKNIAFMQFSGDLINGYLASVEETLLEYANWKRAVEPFAHYFPVYTAMGNHEALVDYFDSGRYYPIRIAKFPFDCCSAEAIFAQAFVNPVNGPTSEDGASYDPNPNKINFPSYRENVFYYTYDNVAMVVLNSNYFFSPSANRGNCEGNLHGYIMDNQLHWLEEVVTKLEKDNNIDHIFVTLHTPVFPNGGHSKNDMWYFGSNRPRPIIAGKPLAKGILERRDQFLGVLMGKSTKVVAILTGDEHNYCRMELTKDTNIYPKKWRGPKLTQQGTFRNLWQVNNGAAGAPYYAQEKLPWSNRVRGFTTQNAVVFFHINGKKIKLQVVNPDTLETIDSCQIR